MFIPLTNKISRKENALGFMLIEVMVAIIVFSIGLIGIAGLLVSVINRNQSSVYHSIAVSLATDIAERMRANQSDTVLTTSPPTSDYLTQLTSGAPTTGTSCTSASATCTAAAMAISDANDWETLVGKILPGGKGVVCLDTSDSADDGYIDTTTGTLHSGCNAAGTSIVIKIFWDESHVGGRASGSGAANSTQRYVVVVQP